MSERRSKEAEPEKAVGMVDERNALRPVVHVMSSSGSLRSISLKER